MGVKKGLHISYKIKLTFLHGEMQAYSSNSSNIKDRRHTGMFSTENINFLASKVEHSYQHSQDLYKYKNVLK